MHWKDKARAHPNIVSWLVLSIGFLLVLAHAARDESLRSSQAFALGLMTVAVAGMCARIISWEVGGAADGPEDRAEAE